VEFLQETAKILKELSPVEADIYIKKLAEETKISEGAIRLEINGNNNTENAGNLNIRPVREAAGRQQQREGSPRPGSMIERYLIRLMLLKSSYVPKVKPYEWVFRSPAAYKIYELILSVYRDDEEIDMKKVEDGLEAEDNQFLQDIIDNIQLADKEEQVFQDCIARIEAAGLAKREQEIIQIISILDDEKDRDKIEALTIELIEIQRSKNKDKR
jgi:DNA primase